MPTYLFSSYFRLFLDYAVLDTDSERYINDQEFFIDFASWSKTTKVPFCFFVTFLLVQIACCKVVCLNKSRDDRFQKIL